jgi:hypothetical protein
MLTPEDCAELTSAPKSTFSAVGYVSPRGLGGHRLPLSIAAPAIKQLVDGVARREGRTAVVEEVFYDEPLSEGQTWGGAAQMLHRVNCGGVDALAACTLAHLVRSEKTLLRLCELLAAHRVRLLTIMEHFDTTLLSAEDLAEYARTAFRESGIRSVPDFLYSRRPTTTNG